MPYFLNLNSVPCVTVSLFLSFSLKAFVCLFCGLSLLPLFRFSCSPFKPENALINAFLFCSSPCLSFSLFLSLNLDFSGAYLLSSSLFHTLLSRQMTLLVNAML